MPLALYPEQSRVILDEWFVAVTSNWGVIYIALGIFSLVFLLWLALGRHGQVLLAHAPDDPPRFSTFGWSSMLFCGGIGTSVMYWGTVEWAYYFQDPPFALESQSAAALDWALAYPIFHWGVFGWAFYCLPGVAMGYMFYHGRSNALRLSTTCENYLPGVFRKPLMGGLDLLFVVGLLGASSTGFGLGIPMISALIADLAGWPLDSLTWRMDVIVIAIITALFVGSTWLGLEKGIKRLSELNIWGAIAIMVFVFLFGPTLFIAERSIETSGFLLQNFLRMSTYADSERVASFVESWTVFYWAWWLALGPFMGVFIAKISEGRTLKQVILGCLLWGTLGCALFFLVLGGFAAHLHLQGEMDVLASITARGAPVTIVSVLGYLPLATLAVTAFLLVCVIFAATSYDSISYALATAVSKNLGTEQEPGTAHRIFWAVSLAMLPLVLIYVGGLRTLQAVVTLASVPLVAVFLLLAWMLWRELGRDNRME